MLNSAWKSARKRAGLNQLRVHDLKHTFGRRLRAVEVNFEERQDLLGHKSSRVTTHYSNAEFSSLIAAANKACEINISSPTLVSLKIHNISASSRKSPASDFVGRAENSVSP